MKVKITIIIIIAIILGFLYINNKKQPIMESREYLTPILWPFNLNLDTTYSKIINGEIEHPLQIGVTAISYFAEGLMKKNPNYIKRGDKLLHVLDNYPYKRDTNNSVIYLYNQNHGSLKAQKWWSGMANSSIALAYLYGYKTTGNLNYKSSAIKALNGVIQPIKSNGSAIILDANSSWYLEYAEDKSNAKNSKFVLNGFNFSLVVLKIFQEEMKNPIYGKAYEKGIMAFKKYSKQFYFPNNSWNYYMLNPLTIESVHYAIFDSILISSLLLYDKENIKFLKNELQKRKKILKKHYNFEKYPDGTLLFSAVGIPHPYWIDIYPTQLKIHYKNNQQKNIEIIPKNFKQKISKRAFIFIDANESKEINSIEIFQKYNNHSNKLFTIKTENLKSINKTQAIPKVITSSKKYFEDLYKDKNNTYMKLHKDKTSRGFIQYKLKTPIDLWKKKYFSMFIDNAIDLSSIRIVLIDIKGQSSERYYPAQDAGKNLILLSALGFRNQNIDHQIKEIRFYLYSQNNNIKKAPVSFSELMYMNSNKPLYNLLKTNDEYGGNLFKFKELMPKKH